MAMLDILGSEPTRLQARQVRTDGGTQMRSTLNIDAVKRYAEAYMDGASLPPLLCYYDGDEYWLADGFHRLAALRGIHGPAHPHGDYEVMVTVAPGTRRDAILHAAGANNAHGLPRTDADKERSVDTLLKDEEWGKWSDREIARRCAVSPTFVGRRRSSLTVHVDSETPTERTYTNKQGVTATMKTANIGASPRPKQLNAIECEALIWKVLLRVAPAAWKERLDWLRERPVFADFDSATLPNCTATDAVWTVAWETVSADIQQRITRESSRILATVQAPNAQNAPNPSETSVLRPNPPTAPQTSEIEALSPTTKDASHESLKEEIAELERWLFRKGWVLSGNLSHDALSKGEYRYTLTRDAPRARLAALRRVEAFDWALSDEAPSPGTVSTPDPGHQLASLAGAFRDEAERRYPDEPEAQIRFLLNCNLSELAFVAKAAGVETGGRSYEARGLAAKGIRVDARMEADPREAPDPKAIQLKELRICLLALEPPIQRWDELSFMLWGVRIPSQIVEDQRRDALRRVLAELKQKEKPDV